MVKSLVEVSPELPWTDDFEFFFESDTLIFTIFIANPVLRQETKRAALAAIFNGLKGTYLKPWVGYYAWTERVVELELVTDYKVAHGPKQRGPQSTGSSSRRSTQSTTSRPNTLALEESSMYDYIYGKLQFGDGVTDEWLLVHIITSYITSLSEPSASNNNNSNNNPILRDLQIAPQDIVMHFFDQDGEFLLVEAADHIPEWCEPANTFNRLWVNGAGDMLLIPQFDASIKAKHARGGKEEGYAEEGNTSLELSDALLFLEKRGFMADRVSLKNARDHIWNTRLKTVIHEALKYTVTTDVIIDRKLAHIVIRSLSYHDGKSSLCSNAAEPRNLNIIPRSLGAFVTQQLSLGSAAASTLEPHISDPKLQKKFRRVFGSNEEKDLVLLKVNIPFLWYSMLKLNVRPRNPKEPQIQEVNTEEDKDAEQYAFQRYMGQALLIGFQNLVESDYEIEAFFDSVIVSVLSQELSEDTISKFNAFVGSDPLQTALLEQNVISERVETVSFETFNEDAGKEMASKNSQDKSESPTEDELMKKIQDFIQEKDTGHSSNKVASSSTAAANSTAKEKSEINLDDYYNEDSDYDTDKENEEVINYFKKENITINEDDFFEYFLTEALKVPKEELSGYRSANFQDTNRNLSPSEKRNTKLSEESFTDNVGKNGKRRRAVADDNEEDDIVEYGDLGEDISGEDMQNLAELVKLLQTGAGNSGQTGGPGGAFFQEFFK